LIIGNSKSFHLGAQGTFNGDEATPPAALFGAKDVRTAVYRLLSRPPLGELLLCRMNTAGALEVVSRRREEPGSRPLWDSSISKQNNGL